MNTKERAIAALAKLRNRRVTRYSPDAMDEERGGAVRDAQREPSAARAPRREGGSARLRHEATGRDTARGLTS